MSTVVKNCIYNNSFSFEMDFHEGCYALTVYYSNGDEKTLHIDYDMIEDLGELGKAILEVHTE